MTFFSVNAFLTEFLQAYRRLSGSLTEDGYDVRAVVLSSLFPKIFTAGHCIFLKSFGLIQMSILWLIDSTWSNCALLGSGDRTDGSRTSLQNRKKIHALPYPIVAAERAPIPCYRCCTWTISVLTLSLHVISDMRHPTQSSLSRWGS